jgi:phosphate transport system permease protein
MTDLTQDSGSVWSTQAAVRNRKRRHAADRRLRLIGAGAIGLAMVLLGTLIVSIVATGWPAFLQTRIVLEVDVDPQHVEAENAARGNFRALVQEAIVAALPPDARDHGRAAADILSNGAQLMLRDRVAADPGLIGETVRIEIPASDPFDQLAKGTISRDTPETFRRVTDRQIAWWDHLVAEGSVSTQFNWGLFFNADSRFPELAGLAGAIIGSFLALLVCFLLSFPLGIAAAVYLEEFARRNRWTDLIEVNINNLAAVPSVVFGLLGLVVFIGWFGLPRSAPLVGGMVLSLMTLPTIIIATRAALKSVPPSIREAALAIGASKHEMVLHHVLPLAMPGILTGTIIGLAQALGEAAPLLLIGMNAFITSTPEGVLNPATALPTQIFIWADSPERGFVARTSAGIMVLLGFLLVMNAVAIYLRHRFERRW